MSVYESGAFLLAENFKRSTAPGTSSLSKRTWPLTSSGPRYLSEVGFDTSGPVHRDLASARSGAVAFPSCKYIALGRCGNHGNCRAWILPSLSGSHSTVPPADAVTVRWYCVCIAMARDAWAGPQETDTSCPPEPRYRTPGGPSWLAGASTRCTVPGSQPTPVVTRPDQIQQAVSV